MLKRVVVFFFVFVVLILALNVVSADSGDVFYEYLKLSENTLTENPGGRDINQIRGSADYTWRIYKESLDARKQEFANQIEITRAMDIDIQNRLLNYYKEINDPPLINNPGFSKIDDMHFRENVYDAIIYIVGSALGSQQQQLKHDYRLKSAQYYWETIVKPEWDSAVLRGNFIRVLKNKKYGLINMAGKTVLEAKFDRIYMIGNNITLGMRQKSSTQKEFVNIDGKVAFTIPSNYILEDFYNGQAIVYTQTYIDRGGRQFIGKAGVIDTKGKFVIPMKNYSNIIKVLTNNNKLIYSAFKLEGSGSLNELLDPKGKVILPSKYDIYFKTDKWKIDELTSMSIGVVDDSLIIAKKKGKYGCINISGKVLVPFCYDNIERFQNGKAVVRKSDKYGVIDRTGKVIIPVQYSAICLAGKNLYNVTANGKCGLLDDNGKVIVKPEWDFVYSDTDKISNVCKNNKWGYVNNVTGKLILPAVYKDQFTFIEGIARFNKDGKLGFITEEGKVISEPQWDDGLYSSHCENGYINVYKDDKAGFIDRTGKIVIKPEWDQTGRFDKNGFVWVKKANWSGIIDAGGNVVISSNNLKPTLLSLGLSPEEDIRFASTFKEGLALVMIRGRFYYVDKSGKIPFYGNYSIAEPFENGYARVYDGKTYNMLENELCFEHGNPNDTYTKNDVVPMYRWLSQGGCFHIIDKKGNIVLTYTKYMVRTPTNSKDPTESDSQLCTDVTWNDKQEFPQNLVKHVLYDDKEGIVILKKK